MVAVALLIAVAGCGDRSGSSTPTSPGVWVVGSGPFSGSAAIGPLGGVATHSDDGGDTWQPEFFESGLSGVHFIDRSRGWLVGVGDVLSTRDGGATWESQRDRFPPAAKGFPSFTAVTFLDEQRGAIVGQGLLAPVSLATPVVIDALDPENAKPFDQVGVRHAAVQAVEECVAVEVADDQNAIVPQSSIAS